MLKKVGRWAAARLQGSKGKQKYDDWMDRNPLVGGALDAAGYIGAGLAAPHLLAKTPLSGLLTGGKMGATGKAVGGMGDDALAAVTKAAPMAAQAPALSAVPSGIGGTVRAAGNVAGKAARGAWDFAKANPLASATALQGLLEGYGNSQELERQRQQDRWNRERQQNLAQLLMPMFANYYLGE